MKQILLCICLLSLFSLSLFAQPANTRDAGNRRASQEFVLSQALNDHLSAYRTANAQQKKALVSQIKRNLFAQFDLSIQAKEAEVAEIKKQIARIKGSPASQTQNQEIQELEYALQKIQGSINFRKTNREKIVAQRLREITQE